MGLLSPLFCENVIIFLSIYVSRVLTGVLRRETVIANAFTMRSASVQDISAEAVVSLNLHFILINKIGLESFLSSTLHIFRIVHISAWIFQLWLSIPLLLHKISKFRI